MGRHERLTSPRQKRIHRRNTLKAALILAASFLLYAVALTAQASDDGSAVVEITATLEKNTVPDKQPIPKPRPPGGGGGDDDHHHHDDDDDTPPKKDPEPETPELPIVPVVYLPGPGITKVKAVPVPGEAEIRYITRTVTGNEAILPEPGKPAQISVSGNGSATKNRVGIAVNFSLDRAREAREGMQKSLLWLIWILILLLFLVLAVWLFTVRKEKKSKQGKQPDPSEDQNPQDL